MFYAGIGSRETPSDVLEYMKEVAKYMSSLDYCLRSGRAKGADRAFEEGCDSVAGKKDIYLAKDAGEPYSNWAWNEILKCFPDDRNPLYFDSWKLYTKQLLVRDMYQILGKFTNEPVKFVACWTPSLNYQDSSSGGTGWAIRCALLYKIPVYNFYSEKDKKQFELTNF